MNAQAERADEVLLDDVDVLVVGGGVVGCAVLRELSGCDVRVAMIEARGDVGDATSKANTAILHTGFDAVPGSQESTLVARGYALLSEYAVRTGIPVEPTGALLVAWDEEQLGVLPSLLAKAQKNGYLDCSLVDAAAVYARVPHLGPGALGGLAVPGESIICPWTTPLAYATEAVARGARIHLSAAVQAVDVGPESTVVRTTRGDVRTRWLVNAAGLGGDAVDRMLGHDRFDVVPRRGELLVFDKLARRLVDVIVLPVPTSKGKGVLVSPTVFGNVMLGPTSENLTDRSDTSTSEDGFAFLLEKGGRLMPDLLREDVTAAYAGLRASTQFDDYVLDTDPAQRYVLLGGIRSTGLTASMALGEWTAQRLRDAGLPLPPRGDLPDPPRMPNIGEAFPRPYQQADRIEGDPEYGRIVCFCERVSRGEVRDALRSALPPCDADGLRRRTRAMMGRCQGFYCGAEIDALLRGDGE
mgnify:CR=1 FL=1